MKIAILRQGNQLLMPRVLMATGLADRVRGLLGRDGLEPGTGMLLKPCGSVHTIGMRFTIDVVYFDAYWHVVRIARQLAPWRLSFGGIRAKAALEVQSGWLDVIALEKGVPVIFAE